MHTVHTGHCLCGQLLATKRAVGRPFEALAGRAIRHDIFLHRTLSVVFKREIEATPPRQRKVILNNERL